MPAVLLVTALMLQAPSPPQTCVVEGARFRLHCHFDDRPSAARALQVVEATVPVASALFGDAGGSERLDVHLYRNTADYAAAEARLTGGAFARNLAFAHFATRTAHVALQPDLSDAALRAIGPTRQTLRLLAHEAAHLLRYAAMPGYRTHPEWFADGSASWVETQVLSRLGLLDGTEAAPHYATSVLRVQRLRARDALPSVDALLLDRLGGLEFYERYAVRWLWFRFLRERHAAELRRLIDAIAAAGDGDCAARVHADARRIFGAAAFAALDAGFAAFVGALRPVWDQTLATLSTAGSDWEQAAFDRNALAWRTEPAGAAYELSGAVRILAGSSEQMNVLLGRDERGFVSVALRPGGVTVSAHDAEAEAGRRLGQARVAALELDRPVPFTVHVDGSILRLDVAGQRAIQLDVQRALDGAWGLGAQANAAGVWSKVECVGAITAAPASARRDK